MVGTRAVESSKMHLQYCGNIHEEHHDLICTICDEVVRTHSSCPRCNKSFCRECMDQWFKTQKSKDVPCSCPCCRRRLTYSDLNTNICLQQQLDALEVLCPHAGLGCTATFCRKKCEVHLKEECPHAQTSCKLCGYTSTRQDMETHESAECSYRAVPCKNANKGCTARVPLSNLQDHLHLNCPKEPGTCRICGEEVNREDWGRHVYLTCSGRMYCPHRHQGCGQELPAPAMEAHVQTCPFKSRVWASQSQCAPMEVEGMDVNYMLPSDPDDWVQACFQDNEDAPPAGSEDAPSCIPSTPQMTPKSVAAHLRADPYVPEPLWQLHDIYGFILQAERCMKSYKRSHQGGSCREEECPLCMDFKKWQHLARTIRIEGNADLAELPPVYSSTLHGYQFFWLRSILDHLARVDADMELDGWAASILNDMVTGWVKRFLQHLVDVSYDQEASCVQFSEEVVYHVARMMLPAGLWERAMAQGEQAMLKFQDVACGDLTEETWQSIQVKCGLVMEVGKLSILVNQFAPVLDSDDDDDEEGPPVDVGASPDHASEVEPGDGANEALEEDQSDLTEGEEEEHGEEEGEYDTASSVSSGSSSEWEEASSDVAAELDEMVAAGEVEYTDTGSLGDTGDTSGGSEDAESSGYDSHEYDSASEESSVYGEDKDTRGVVYLGAICDHLLNCLVTRIRAAARAESKQVAGRQHVYEAIRHDPDLCNIFPGEWTGAQARALPSMCGVGKKPSPLWAAVIRDLLDSPLGAFIANPLDFRFYCNTPGKPHCTEGPSALAAPSSGNCDLHQQSILSGDGSAAVLDGGDVIVSPLLNANHHQGDSLCSAALPRPPPTCNIWQGTQCAQCSARSKELHSWSLAQAIQFCQLELLAWWLCAHKNSRLEDDLDASPVQDMAASLVPQGDSLDGGRASAEANEHDMEWEMEWEAVSKLSTESGQEAPMDHRLGHSGGPSQSPGSVVDGLLRGGLFWCGADLPRAPGKATVDALLRLLRAECLEGYLSGKHVLCVSDAEELNSVEELAEPSAIGSECLVAGANEDATAKLMEAMAQVTEQGLEEMLDAVAIYWLQLPQEISAGFPSACSTESCTNPGQPVVQPLHDLMTEIRIVRERRQGSLAIDTKQFRYVAAGCLDEVVGHGLYEFTEDGALALQLAAEEFLIDQLAMSQQLADYSHKAFVGPEELRLASLLGRQRNGQAR